MITVRPYSAEWRLAEYQPLQTSFGTLSIQPLGWGIRVESKPDNDSLVINGSEVRLGWADYVNESGEWKLNSDGINLKKANSQFGLDDATPKQKAKLKNELPGLVAAWALANAAEVEKRREAWIYERARICEESIEELEGAAAEYRSRLEMIEDGNMDISPYLNGGRNIRT